MTSPQPEPTDPNVSASELAVLQSLIQGLSSGLTVAGLLSILGSLPGISLEAISALFETRPVLGRKVLAMPTASVASPDAVRNTARLNLVRRAQYLVNAARRVSAGAANGQLGESIDAEQKLFAAHQAATRKRQEAGQTVAEAEASHGPVLGWYAVDDSRTTADCRRMDKRNFYAHEAPPIGYPGAVHPHCRCTPGRPHLDARGRPKAPVGYSRQQEVAAMNRYPDDASMIELARTAGSLIQTAKQLGVSRVSLTNYLLRRPALDSAVRVVLSSRASKPVELAGPPMAARKKAATEHKALPDGSFPIRNRKDLANAISAYGRAKPEHRTALRRLIRSRAKELGVKLSDKWSSDKDVRLAASSSYPDLERVPGKQNWVDKAGGLPPYIERIAKHLHYEKGMPIGRAIATAVNTVKRWAAGGAVTEHGTTKTISAKTQAQAAAAVAQWEAKKASAHSHANPVRGSIELAGYSEEQLKSYYAAKPSAKSAPKKGSTTGGSGKKRVVRTQAGANRYHVPIGSEIGKARNAQAAKTQQNTKAVDKYKQTVGAKDRDAQIARLTPDELGQLSSVAFSFKSSDPNVVALRNSVVQALRQRGMDPKKFGYLGK